VLYLCIPLVIIFFCYLEIGASLHDAFRGPDAMFVVFIAFFEVLRDSLKSLQLQKKGHDDQNTMLIIAVVLLVASVITLYTSIAVTQGALPHIDRQGLGDTTQFMLWLSLGSAWLYKCRLKGVERRVERQTKSAPVTPAATLDGL
jgi:low temperature requirement protein LtrA